MTGGASFKVYSDSYSNITHNKTVVPAVALTREDVALRQAGAEAKKKQRLEKQLHQVGDIAQGQRFYISDLLVWLEIEGTTELQSKNG